MAVAQKALAYIEIDDFLAMENASQNRHEYLDGFIYAVQGDCVQGEVMRGMAGGSQVHARLIRNATFALHSQLQGSPCEVLGSDMRLRVDVASAVFYPDVLVHCQSSADPAATTELTEARLVLEVLSPSTQAFDKGAKLLAYQRLPGLRHIVLISSTEEAAWACERGDDDTPWSTLQPWAPGTNLPLPGIAAELSWDAVYGGVGLAPPRAP